MLKAYRSDHLSLTLSLSHTLSLSASLSLSLIEREREFYFFIKLYFINHQLIHQYSPCGHDGSIDILPGTEEPELHSTSQRPDQCHSTCRTGGDCAFSRLGLLSGGHCHFTSGMQQPAKRSSWLSVVSLRLRIILLA